MSRLVEISETKKVYAAGRFALSGRLNFELLQDELVERLLVNKHRPLGIDQPGVVLYVVLHVWFFRDLVVDHLLEFPNDRNPTLDEVSRIDCLDDVPLGKDLGELLDVVRRRGVQPAYCVEETSVC